MDMESKSSPLETFNVTAFWERLVDWYWGQIRIKNELWITREEALAIAERYVAENGLCKIGNLDVDKDSVGFTAFDGGRPGLCILISPSGEILDK